MTLATLATVIDPGAVQPPGTEGLVSIMSWVKWVALALAVAGLMVGGAMVNAELWSRRAGPPDAVEPTR